MWKTNRKFEEEVIAVNQSVAARGSGGVGWITTGIEAPIRVVWLPDSHTFSSDENGRFVEELNLIQVSVDEWEKFSFIPGKTQIRRNGKTYRVTSVFDYTDKPPINVAEMEVVRRIDFD